MTPFISIITVNYNNATGLKKTMGSVLNQTYDDFEYIVVDGDSNDGSKEVLTSFDHTRLTGISESDTGIYNAMNKGIRKARGKYLLFLNSGDYLVSEDILKKVAPEINMETPFAGCDLILDSEEGQVRKSHPKAISLSYLLRRTIYHPSTFIRRDMFEKYGYYNEELRVVSDWEFFLKTVGLNGEAFERIPTPLTIFDMTGISSKKENLEKIAQEKEQVIQKCLGSFTRSDLDAFLLEQLRNPSKRIKYLMKIEKSPFLRKVATGALGIIKFFKP